MPLEVPHGVRPGRIEPLWDRVDSNRVKVAFFIFAYVISIAVSAALVAAAAGALLGFALIRVPAAALEYYSHLRTIVISAAAAGLAGGCIWVAFAVSRSRKKVLGSLGARLTPTGRYLREKSNLKDISLAAGYQHSPPLWLIPDCDRVNAFAIGTKPGRSVVGITQGFVDRLSDDDQRAVFANLLARVCSGDTRWSTVVTALVGPIWRLRDRDLRRGFAETMAADETEARDSTSGLTVGANVAPYELIGTLLLYGLVVIVTEILLAGHQRQARLSAEKADAEGMLLLKDPETMLRGLETVLQANNTVPTAGESYSNLFYCWAGFGFAPEDDPEFERVARLREVLGVQGLVVESNYGLPDEARGLLSPPAPRIEEAVVREARMAVHPPSGLADARVDEGP